MQSLSFLKKVPSVWRLEATFPSSLCFFLFRHEMTSWEYFVFWGAGSHSYLMDEETESWIVNCPVQAHKVKRMSTDFVCLSCHLLFFQLQPLPS